MTALGLSILIIAVFLNILILRTAKKIARYDRARQKGGKRK